MFLFRNSDKPSMPLEMALPSMQPGQPITLSLNLCDAAEENFPFVKLHSRLLTPSSTRRI